jgi:hypothetical protein
MGCLRTSARDAGSDFVRPTLTLNQEPCREQREQRRSSALQRRELVNEKFPDSCLFNLVTSWNL